MLNETVVLLVDRYGW